MNFKTRRIDRPDLIKACRTIPCQIQSPFCDNGPTVACHSNMGVAGKGMGMKAHDLFIAAGCQTCHDYIDGRLQHSDTRLQEYLCGEGHRRECEINGIFRTLPILANMGLLGGKK